MLRSLLPLILSLCLAHVVQAQLTIAYTYDGALAGNNMGWAVDGAGDVNGDGHDDFVVSEPLDLNNGVPSGSVRVYSGLDGALLHHFAGDDAFDGFGVSVSGAGDVNGDGYADIIVGAYGDDNNGVTSGSARVHSGFDGSVLHMFNGDDADDHFGFSVSGAGDVNADGYADLIVGAFIDEANGFDTGSARVFSGFDGTVLYDLTGDTVGDRFGISVSDAGDVNRDGYDDFIVGAYRDDDNGFNAGSARVYSGLDGSVLHSFFGTSPSDELGFPVAGAGDVNGDGYPDLILGARLDDDNGIDSGSARVHSGLDGSLLYTFIGDGAGDHFGDKVSGAGDMNGDGFADLVVGALFDDNNGANSGMARVYSGADGSVLYQLDGDDPGDWFGYDVRGAGDLNGDGFADLVVGAIRDDDNGTDAGRTRVYLAPTLPALKIRTKTGLTHFLDLSWQPDGADPWSLTGTLVCEGATPAGLGLAGVSLAGADTPYFGFLPVLLDVDAPNLLLTEYFGFDGTGAAIIPNVTRQNPALAGLQVHVQFFETAPIVSSSPAIRLEATM